MPRPKEEVTMNRVIRLRVSNDQHERLRRIAQNAGITVSDILRRSAMGIKIPDATEKETLKELRGLRGDIGRVGGLLKLTISTIQKFDNLNEAAIAFKVAANNCDKAIYKVEKFCEEFKTK